jgi:hypothetical protein
VTTQGPQGPPPGMGGEGAGSASEEELQAALEEQMARLTVPDVIVQTVVTLINLGARKLGLTGASEGGAGERDLDQARMAIEATRSLLPLVPAEVGQIREALSQLQMAYARAAGAGPGTTDPAGEPTASPAPPSGQPEPADVQPGAAGAPPAEEAERAKARAKIWTPGQG